MLWWLDLIWFSYESAKIDREVKYLNEGWAVGLCTGQQMISDGMMPSGEDKVLIWFNDGEDQQTCSDTILMI